jgi:para-aminobenzoate synthetase component 1
VFNRYFYLVGSYSQLSNFSDKEILQKLASVSSFYTDACILVSNDFPGSEKKILAGIGSVKKVVSLTEENAFEILKKEISASNRWLFGHFSYDLKNANEHLFSKNPNGMDFPLANFFEPEFLVQFENEKTSIKTNGNAKPENLFSNVTEIKTESIAAFKLKARTPRAEYISNAKKLIDHIRRGDIYEINYCIEFFAEHVVINPAEIFLKLNSLAEAPFSALYKNGDQWLICASPERFLQKKGSRIISQPIKGTRQRGKSIEEDELLKKELFLDAKERSENVMIVDLVRNDLSKSAKKGTVHVEELFGIHSFKSVHQMISTISAESKENIHPIDIIRNAFPMGSMTGAPKIKAMQLAEEFENRKRGLYSGSVGYFTPELDFDFNVVIRSIQYNSKTGYISLMVGSAITANADPEKEYEECLLKAKTLFESLGVEWSSE